MNKSRNLSKYIVKSGQITQAKHVSDQLADNPSDVVKLFPVCYALISPANIAL